MGRIASSNETGRSFDELIVNAVWQKGQVVSGNDPNVFRKDAFGTWMRRSDYGNTDSQYGWEIDHIEPVSVGGTDHLNNLQPLQWQNNRTKGDVWPNWRRAVVGA